MATKQIVLALVTFLHDLFTVVWIGGLMTLGLTVLPAARNALGPGPQTKKLMEAIQKRLSWFVYASILGLAVTGVLLSNRAPSFHGLFRFDNPYAVTLGLKHILVVVMIAIALYRSLVLGRPGQNSAPPREKLGIRLLLLNMVLGVGVLLLTGLTVGIAASPPPL